MTWFYYVNHWFSGHLMIIWRWIIGWLVNSELERTWKKTSVAYKELLPLFCCEDWGKPWKNDSRCPDQFETVVCRLQVRCVGAKMTPSLLFQTDGYCVRFEVTLKRKISWDLTPFSPVDVYRHFRGTCIYPDDSGSRFLRNVSTHIMRLNGITASRLKIYYYYYHYSY
jgi:hypothetical protein